MPMGRPKIEIDKKQFESLCGLHCTLEEISGFFDCDDDTINNWCKREYNQTFSVVFGQKKGKGKISLRRSQFKLSETNPTMAIWLGKQLLDQKDTKDINLNDLRKIEIVNDLPTDSVE